MKLNLLQIINYPLRWLRTQRIVRNNKEVDKLYRMLTRFYEFRIRLLNEEIKKAYEIKKILRHRKVKIIKSEH